MTIRTGWQLLSPRRPVTELESLFADFEDTVRRHRPGEHP